MGHYFTVAGMSDVFVSNLDQSEIDPQKKKMARIKIAQSLPKDLMPMHAVILRNKNTNINLIISGGSGFGKTTLACELVKKRFEIVANDFIVMWKEDDDLYAGDLNFIENNKSKAALRINHVLLLSPESVRDMFRFRENTFFSFYKSSFDCHLSGLEKYKNGKVLELVYRKHIVLGNRTNPQKWLRSVEFILDSRKIERVGIIGMGTVGQDVASLLLTKRWLKNLNLYSRNSDKTKSLALDLKSANPDVNIRIYNKTKLLLEKSDIVVVSFKSDKKDLNAKQERMQRLNPHIEIIDEISAAISEAKFSGFILVVTNPVDVLSWFLYALTKSKTPNGSRLLSNQVIGIGLGLDYCRLKVLAGNNIFELVGEHGEDLQLTQIQNNKLHSMNDKLLSDVKLYSNKVREHTERTRFGPTHEVIRVIDVLKNGEGIIRGSFLNESGIWLGDVISWFNKAPIRMYEYESVLEKKMEKIIKSYLTQYKSIIDQRS